MAKRPCARPGCPALVMKGYCDGCAAKLNVRVRSDGKRESACARGYGRRWQKASAGYLVRHPLCVDPFRKHGIRVVASTNTDHIVPHKGDMMLFWDPTNWQALCDGCHSTKTATEDGGFGLKPK